MGMVYSRCKFCNHIIHEFYDAWLHANGVLRCYDDPSAPIAEPALDPDGNPLPPIIRPVRFL